jgi:hypothetical protein
MNMNHNEEVPDFLGGLGDMQPADVLKMVNELLELLHRKDKDHQGSPVFIYAPGSQYVEKQINIGASPSTPKPQPLPPSPTGEGERPRDGELPEVLATDEAMILWQKAQQAGYVDDHYQPLLSRTQSALLADAMAQRLGIKEKWIPSIYPWYMGGNNICFGAILFNNVNCGNIFNENLCYYRYFM